VDANLRTIELGAIDLELAALRWINEREPDAEAAELSLKVTAPAQQLLGPEPESIPPFSISLEGIADGILREVDLDVLVAPYHPAPGARVTLALRGIDGTRLPELFPLLAGGDGSGLADAELDLDLGVRIDARRRGATDFDLFRAPFGVEAQSRFELRSGVDGEVLAGIERLEVDAPQIDPRTGDVHVRAIDILEPRAQLVLRSDHVETLGLRIPLASVEAAVAEEPEQPGEQPGEEPDEEPAETASVEDPPAPGASDELPEGSNEPVADTSAEEPASPDDAPSEEPVEEAASADDAEPRKSPVRGPEIRIDEFVITGSDILLRDETAEPAANLPIDDMYVEVLRFSNRALVETRPIKFRVFLGGGDVSLPVRVGTRGLVGGMASFATSLATSVIPGDVGPGDNRPLEPRPAFEEISLDGNLVLYPYPQGRVTLEVASLELTNFRGRAREAGTVISDGFLDARVDAELRGSEGYKIELDPTFHALRISEGENGPVRSFLRLPVPLDTFLWIWRQPDESIRPRITVEEKEGAVSGAQVTSAVLGTLGTMTLEAVAKSPLRIGGSVTRTLGGLWNTFLGWFGLGKDDTPPEPPPPLALEFAPGDTTLTPSARWTVAEIAKELRGDKKLGLALVHELGSADVTRAEVLANPSREDAHELAAGALQRLHELERARSEHAAELRARLLVEDEEQTALARARLSTLDREIGMTEAALDEVLVLLRPGAEQRSGRRTRRACLEIGRRRIALVHAALAELGVPDVEERVTSRRPRFEAVEDQAVGRIWLLRRTLR
jgi:hypothetical protein